MPLEPTSEQHAKRQGKNCPACHSTNLDYSRYELEDRSGWQPAECRDCGATWTDTYKLAPTHKPDGNGKQTLSEAELQTVINGDCPACRQPATFNGHEISNGAINAGYTCYACDSEYHLRYPLAGYTELEQA